MRALTITLGLMLLPSYALAQFGNPGGWAPDTRMESPGKPAPNQTNYQDRLFARLAAAGGLAEVELGRLAAGKSTNDDVKAFAGRMVDDHSAANTRLKAIAEKSKMPVPDGLDPDHEKMRADLDELEAAKFDLEYMKAQVIDHQKTVQLLVWEIGSGQDAEMQQFAKETLPKVLEHLEMAREIQAQLAGETVVRPASAQ